MTDTIAADLAAVARINVVPTILEVVCRLTGMGFSAVARVTEDRWIACAVRDEIQFGLAPGGELRLETTICNEIRQSGELVVIDDVSKDECFRDHPTPQMYGFQSYISVPIHLPDGRFFGTLCAIDPKPAQLKSGQTVTMFKLYAELIGMHLDASDRLQSTETALLDERQQVELREQFIAVLGHDLRNPLSAIRTGTKFLQTKGLSKEALDVTAVIDRSAGRMSGLIDDILDFARARLGSGLTISRQLEMDLQSILQHVVDEARTANPGRAIESAVHVHQPILCDRVRIGQLLANLLANALTHGSESGRVSVRAEVSRGGLQISVENQGRPLSRETMSRLFQPFARGGEESRQDGLGLGLYIASETARAHGGVLDVFSSGGETRFTFIMPLT